MLRISLLWIGKTKYDWLKTGIEHYVKRLKRYFDVKIIELKDEKIKNKQKNNMLRKKEQEAKNIKNILEKNKYYKVILDERGKEFSSIDFAKYLRHLEMKGTRDVIFIIGGPYGFTDEIINLADFKLSLSRLTFTHDMSRLILLEQLYRAANINGNTSYHH